MPTKKINLKIKNLNVLLGVSGGIAAYKVVDLASKLTAAGAGVKTVGDLLSLEEEALLAIRGFGAKSLEQVREALEAKGFVQS